MESAFPIVSAPSILAITRCRHRQNRLFFVTSPPHISSHRRLRFLVCVPNAVAGRGDESGIYQQSQSISPVFPPKDIVAFTVPAGAFLVVTFGNFYFFWINCHWLPLVISDFSSFSLYRLIDCSWETMDFSINSVVEGCRKIPWTQIK